MRQLVNSSQEKHRTSPDSPSEKWTSSHIDNYHPDQHEMTRWPHSHLWSNFSLSSISISLNMELSAIIQSMNPWGPSIIARDQFIFQWARPGCLWRERADWRVGHFLPLYTFHSACWPPPVQIYHMGPALLFALLPALLSALLPALLSAMLSAMLSALLSAMISTLLSALLYALLSALLSAISCPAKLNSNIWEKYPASALWFLKCCKMIDCK